MKKLISICVLVNILASGCVPATQVAFAPSPSSTAEISPTPEATSSIHDIPTHVPTFVGTFPASKLTDNHSNVSLTLTKADYSKTNTMIYIDIGIKPFWKVFDPAKMYYPHYVEIHKLDIIDENGNVYKQQSSGKASQSTYDSLTDQIITHYQLNFDPIRADAKFLHLETPLDIFSQSINLLEIPADTDFSLSLSDKPVDKTWEIGKTISISGTDILFDTGKIYLQSPGYGSFGGKEQVIFEINARVVNESTRTLDCLMLRSNQASLTTGLGGSCSLAGKKLIIDTILSTHPLDNKFELPSGDIPFKITGSFQLHEKFEVSWPVLDKNF